MITLKQILKNGGTTINESGNPVNYKTGFQVSKCDLAIIPTYKLRKYQIVEALNLINEDECLGVWIDKGKAYIDISERISNYKHALKVGRDRKQISVWAWKKATAIGC